MQVGKYVRGIFMSEPRHMVLLGAGASKEAGVPLAVEMTEEMLRLCQQDGRNDYARALNALSHMLKISGSDSWNTDCADVESVMNAVRFLANRSELEFSPFVGAWHPVIEDLENRGMPVFTENKVRGIVSKAVQDNKMEPRRGVRGSDDVVDIEAALQCIGSDFIKAISHRSEGDFFKGMEMYLTSKLLKLTYRRDTKKLDYLSPLIEYGGNDKITIATLNYDNCIELKSAEMRIQCATGITHLEEGGVGGWNYDRAFPEITMGVDLIKLHGSANWFWNDPKEDHLGFGNESLYVAPSTFIDDLIAGKTADDETIGNQLAVIFGGHNKLIPDGPFLALLSKFERELNKHKSLIVIGYSFRDRHVNVCISRRLKRARGNKVIVIDREGASQNNCPLTVFFKGTAQSDQITHECIGARNGIEKYFSLPSRNAAIF